MVIGSRQRLAAHGNLEIEVFSDIESIYYTHFESLPSSDRYKFECMHKSQFPMQIPKDLDLVPRTCPPDYFNWVGRPWVRV